MRAMILILAATSVAACVAPRDDEVPPPKDAAAATDTGSTDTTSAPPPSTDAPMTSTTPVDTAATAPIDASHDGSSPTDSAPAPVADAAAACVMCSQGGCAKDTWDFEADAELANWRGRGTSLDELVKATAGRTGRGLGMDLAGLASGYGGGQIEFTRICGMSPSSANGLGHRLAGWVYFDAPDGPAAECRMAFFHPTDPVGVTVLLINNPPRRQWFEMAARLESAQASAIYGIAFKCEMPAGAASWTGKIVIDDVTLD